MITATPHAASLPTAYQLTALRRQLLEQRQFRREQLRSLDAPGTRYGAEGEIADMLRMAARVALRDVEQALTRMAEGSYGRCVECRERMPLARLEVLPQIARCMRCQRPPTGSAPDRTRRSG